MNLKPLEAIVVENTPGGIAITKEDKLNFDATILPNGSLR